MQKKIADGLGVTLSEVYGVATFYAQFSLEPNGKYVISVCLGTACYVKGSQKVLDRLSEELNIPVGDTTDDGLFTLQRDPLPGRVRPGSCYDHQRGSLRPPGSRRYSRHSGQI